MRQQDKDKIIEEQEAPELVADIREIYKTSTLDTQSLARIRSRLQSRARTLQIGGTNKILYTKKK